MVDIPLIYIPTWALEGEYEPEAHCVNKALPTSLGPKQVISM